MSEKLILELKTISKSYRGQVAKALDCVSASFKAGEVIGLLGPNGAGESTFIKICVGLLEADVGDVNYNINADTEIGYVPEEQLAFSYMTGFDFLNFVGALRGLSKKDIMNTITNLEGVFKFPNLNHLISSYSNGNKQKVLMASSLLHLPKLLILDEPFNGFDPEIVANLKTYLLDYASQGNTILFSSHILDTVSQICSKVILINNGKIVYEALSNENDSKKLEELYLSLVSQSKVEN